MTLSDAARIGAGNLLRMKLRATLTILGVVIAIGAFVSMLSFAAGSRGQIVKEYNDLGLFHTMHVYPDSGDEDGQADSATSEAAPPLLDEAAIEALSAIPGVKLAYPYEDFSATATIGETVVDTDVQALPSEAAQTELFSKFTAGAGPEPGATGLAVVSAGFLDRAGVEDPRSAIGKELILTVKKPSIERSIMRAINDRDGSLGRTLAAMRADSLGQAEYRSRLLREGLGTVSSRFLDAYQNHPIEERDTLIICGVLSRRHQQSLGIKPVLVSVEVARTLGAGAMSSDPTDIFASLQSGSFFRSDVAAGFSRVTLDLDMRASHAAVGDSVEALGFHVFSFAGQFDEIRRAFLVFELGLAAVGLVALVTASLGIMNTMVMSISERRGEIGILKSLGADERMIRNLFLVESCIIGVVGAAFGVVLGWIVSRIASVVLQKVMEHQEAPPMDLFATPPWLILLALAIGLGVSLVSGLFPSGRAARVDPVKALRNE